MKRSLVLAVVMAGAWTAAAAQAPSETKSEEARPAAAAQTQAPDLKAARERVAQVCAACHGADGNSVSPANPTLAGMPAEYITQQLEHFKAGIRANPIMQGMAAPLSSDDMKALGLYFSQQKAKPQAAKDAALAQAGQKLYRGGDASHGIPACAACHAPNGTGIPKNYPRLAGQHADYTIAQLKAFRAGERGNDKDGKDRNGRVMTAIAAKLSDSQMQALAQYVQGLR